MERKGDEKRKMKKNLRREMRPRIMKISSVESLKSQKRGGGGGRRGGILKWSGRREMKRGK